MGVCGSTAQTGTGDGPIDKRDDVDGPVSKLNDRKEDKEKENVDKNSNQTNQHVSVKNTGNTSDTSGNDERDVGLVPVGYFNQNSFTGLDIIDLDDNEEYLQAIQKAYQRPSPRLTRLDLLADVYKMDFPRRGKAIVINNEKFKDSPQRKGTWIDYSKICNRLQRLGFQVEGHNDVTCNQIMAAFVNTANEDHSDADCFVGVFLSHGESNEIHGIDGVMKLSTIFELFHASRCKGLAGKPKLFFIQSCRGEAFDDGVHLNVADAQGYVQQEPEVELTIPDEADFLISYSTVDGYYSWRNAKNGSWYIQALVRVLDECGTLLEIQKLLTRVHKLVANEFESKERSRKRRKQIPSFISRLTKDLYFNPK
ncbi:caspase-7-like [Ruditapes philippinarum]|uniref:caspase-7-like n=1 Tax=Ruditapes philippinarum TaxID=129788 RepID=UPI00295AD40E|nr:caspase-7-like [Ruditapes philippinarum]